MLLILHYCYCVRGLPCALMISAYASRFAGGGLAGLAVAGGHILARHVIGCVTVAWREICERFSPAARAGSEKSIYCQMALCC